MAPSKIGFGIEIETSVKPYDNQWWDSGSHFSYLAKTLELLYGIPAVGNRTSAKYPSNYDKWWITADSSIDTPPGFSMCFPYSSH